MEECIENHAYEDDNKDFPEVTPEKLIVKNCLNQPVPEKKWTQKYQFIQIGSLERTAAARAENGGGTGVRLFPAIICFYETVLNHNLESVVFVCSFILRNY